MFASSLSTSSVLPTQSARSSAFSEEGWFAVQVTPRHEERVALMLELKGYGQFVPMSKKQETSADAVLQPLFPGYVFCRMLPAAKGLLVTTPGVIRILGNGGSPTFLHPDEVRNIRRIANCGLPAESQELLQAGAQVRIEGGPLNGLVGFLVRTRKRRKLAVSVTLLSRSIIVDLEGTRVRALTGLRKANESESRILTR